MKQQVTALISTKTHQVHALLCSAALAVLAVHVVVMLVSIVLLLFLIGVLARRLVSYHLDEGVAMGILPLCIN